jgi:hypothetical protein
MESGKAQVGCGTVNRLLAGGCSELVLPLMVSLSCAAADPAAHNSSRPIVKMEIGGVIEVRIFCL